MVVVVLVEELLLWGPGHPLNVMQFIANLVLFVEVTEECYVNKIYLIFSIKRRASE